MTGELKVSGSQIDLLVGAMRNGHKGMAETLEALTTSLDKLARDWNGEARRAYAQAQAHWNQQMADLHDELDRARRNTTLANETMTEAQRTIRRMWSGS